MSNTWDRERLLRSTVLAGFAASGLAFAPAVAQDAVQTSQADCRPGEVLVNGACEVDTSEERIVITGSRIARTAANAPTPLIQLDGDDIILSGEPNIVDYLADVPALQGSQVPEDTTGSNLNDGGLSLLDLRDLGAVRTLVLVDGRRHVGSSPGSLSVDVDTIPSMLVESVEVITGGQSAVYGADAVSGVVNFILRDDFDGIEVDATVAQINQDGQLNSRISAAWGDNFLDGRLNVYAFGEYQDTEEVLDFDIDWKRDAWALTGGDSDSNANPNDGVFDSVLVRDSRDAFFARGGVMVLASQARPTATNNPTTPYQNCVIPSFNLISGACSPVRADTGAVYAFNADGTARPFNFGTYQDQNGYSRRLNTGGDGLNVGTEFGQGSRIPRSEAYRFQAGFNFELNPSVTLFGEAKYVEEETFDTGQPTFWQITLWDRPTFYNNNAYLLDYRDNVFAQQAGVTALIDSNVRTVYGQPTEDSPGAVLGTVPDRRAFLGVFGPSRSQLNNRDLTRFVLGAEGVAPDFAFLHNITWEASYTYGEMNNSNLEVGVDIDRFQYATDAIEENGQIICRVQSANPLGFGQTVDTTSAAVTDCTPINLFGTDFRSDANHPDATGGGGRQGLTPEQEAYLLAAIEVTDSNRQHDFLAFGSAETFDFWGAGPIGVALGYEFRREETEGTGRNRDTGDRNLFLNTGPDFPQASYEANEIFTEVRVPLLDNQLWMESAEISGAYRYSDYTTVGEVESVSLQASLRPVEDIFFRATYGEATRIPNLGENFRPATQTFGNGLTDPCDASFIRNRADAADREALRQNCLATMPAGYDPGTDTAGTGTNIQYTSGIQGFNAGNPNLEPEESTSYTFGVAYTPSWLPGFTVTADYFDIEIDNVIASTTVQQNMNQCVGWNGTDVNAVNSGACSTFERSPTASTGGSANPAYGVYTFIQGSLNYAGLETRGIDFTSSYGFETDRFGDFDWSLRGTYLIEQNDFVNIDSPGEETANDSTTGQPHVRLLSTVTWTPVEKLIFSWDWDWQSSQEIIDEDDWRQNADGREFRFTTTGDFSQHDFTVRYLPRENLTLRAGVVNAFDAEPARWLGSSTSADNFDFWGRRFFVGVNVQY